MQSNPPQGINGRRGAHRRRGAPRGRGAPGASCGPGGRFCRGSGAPGGRGRPKGKAAARAPHAPQKNTATRKNNVKRDPSPPAPRSSHRPMPRHFKKCYASQVEWDKCIEDGMISKGVRFGTHYSRLNDYQAGPSHSQSKSLYISRLVIIFSGNCVPTAYFEPKKIRTF